LFWLWQNEELAVIAGKHIPGNALSPVDFFPCRFLALFWPITVVLALSRAATVLDFDERVSWFENGSPR
jgi:hypothetical protein